MKKLELNSNQKDIIEDSTYPKLLKAGAGTGKTRVCSADYEAPISTDSAALQYNDQLCGEKSAHACASLLETAESQYAGSNRGMSIITAANQHAIPRYAGILSP